MELISWSKSRDWKNQLFWYEIQIQNTCYDSWPNFKLYKSHYKSRFLWNVLSIDQALRRLVLGTQVLVTSPLWYLQSSILIFSLCFIIFQNLTIKIRMKLWTPSVKINNMEDLLKMVCIGKSKTKTKRWQWEWVEGSLKQHELKCWKKC